MGTVKGRSEPTELYEVVARRKSFEGSAFDDSQKRFCDSFAIIHELYRSRDFHAALTAIEEYQQFWPDDLPSQILKTRCMANLLKEPEVAWSPVEHLSEK